MEELLNLKQFMTLDKWLITYLIFVWIDLITGLMKAFKTTGFKSRKLREGLIKILSELLAIIFACVLDYVLGLKILMLSMKMLLVAKECVSIVENLGQLGVTIPKIIAEKIEDLNPDKKEEN